MATTMDIPVIKAPKPVETVNHLAKFLEVYGD